MAIDDVLHDGKAKTGAALLAAALHVDTIEALGEARNRVGRNALAIVAHAGGNRGFASTPAAAMHERKRHPDMTALPSVFDRVVEQVLEKLDELVALAGHRRQIGAGEDLDGDVV